MAQQKPKDINWQDFNYPPLIKIIHFSPSEIPAEYKSLIWTLFVSHLLIFIISIINLVDNITQAAQGLSGIRILYSFLFIFLFNPFATFIFYRGLTGVCKQQSLLNWYIYLQPIAIILWITFSIVDFIGFNGFVRVSYLYKAKYSFAGTLSLIQSCLFMLTALISMFSFYKICQIRGELKNNQSKLMSGLNKTQV